MQSVLFLDGWSLFCFFFNDFYFLVFLVFLSCYFFFEKQNISVNFFMQLLKIFYILYFLFSIGSFIFFIGFSGLDFFLFLAQPIFFIATLTFYCFNGYVKVNIGIFLIKLFFIFIFFFFFFIMSSSYLVTTFKAVLLILWAFFLLFFLLIVNHLFLLFLVLEFLSLITILLILSGMTSRSIYLSILYFFLNIFFSSVFILAYTYFLIQNGNGFLDLFFFSGKNNLACFFLFIFFLFKLGAAPFHAWSLDVYEHLSLPVFIFLTVFYKAIIFIVFFKLLFLLFYPFFFFSFYYYFLYFIAFLCILFGIFSPIGETRLLRVFTFSSLYVFGFCLFFWLFNFSEYVFFFFFSYLFSYYFFFILVLFFQRSNKFQLFYYNTDVSRFAKISEFLMFPLIICLLSLSGLPPFLFFFAKYFFFYFFVGLYTKTVFYYFLFCIFSLTLGTFIYFRYLKIILSESFSMFNIFIFSQHMFFFFFLFLLFPFFSFFCFFYFLFFKKVWSYFYYYYYGLLFFSYYGVMYFSELLFLTFLF